MFKQLIAIFIALCSTIAFAGEPAKPSTQAKSITTLDADRAEQFLGKWLAMIDRNAALDEYLKYLPDTDFEQWSYVGANIKNVAELKAYFKKTWGQIKKNRNVIENLSVSDAGAGRYKIVSRISWTATTAADKTFTMPLRYTTTIGNGRSSGDPDGAYPKIYRYQIERLVK